MVHPSHDTYLEQNIKIRHLDPHAWLIRWNVIASKVLWISECTTTSWRRSVVFSTPCDTGRTCTTGAIECEYESYQWRKIENPAEATEQLCFHFHHVQLLCAATSSEISLSIAVWWCWNNRSITIFVPSRLLSLHPAKWRQYVQRTLISLSPSDYLCCVYLFYMAHL